MSEDAVEPVWTVVANMTREERNGREPDKRYHGTPTFSPGARLYVGEAYWGMSEDVHMIGLNRATKRYTNCVTRFLLLQDVRAVLEYSPATIAALKRLKANIYPDRAAAEAAALTIHRTIEWLRTEREQKRADPTG